MNIYSIRLFQNQFQLFYPSITSVIILRENFQIEICYDKNFIPLGEILFQLEGVGIDLKMGKNPIVCTDLGYSMGQALQLIKWVSIRPIAKAILEAYSDYNIFYFQHGNTSLITLEFELKTDKRKAIQRSFKV